MSKENCTQFLKNRLYDDTNPVYRKLALTMTDVSFHGKR
jgi:hypothetical protein